MISSRENFLRRLWSALITEAKRCEWCGTTRPKSQMIHQRGTGWFCDYDEFILFVNLETDRLERAPERKSKKVGSLKRPA
jgi:hypothetical protein